MPNPKRSGGPRSTGGLQAVAHNALKTGVYSKQLLLPGESEADFFALLAQFQQDFQPADVAESTLVHQLAVTTWKKLRLDRAEAGFHRLNLQREFSPADANHVSHLLPAGGELALLNLLNRLPEPDWLVWAQSAAWAVAWVESGRTLVAEDVQHIRQHLPPLAACLQDDLLASGQAVEVFFEEYGHLAQLCDESVLQRTKEALALLRDRRLFTFFSQNPTGQKHDELDRSFQRTLAELRRQQTWRRNLATVTIAPQVQPIAGSKGA